MKQLLTACLAAGALFSAAEAAVTIRLTGEAGKGYTNISFQGSSITQEEDSIRTNGASFTTGDTFQPEGAVRFLQDTSIQNDLFDVTGDLRVKVGGVTEFVSKIFLDSDEGSTNADDFGIRTLTELFYVPGQRIRFQGSGTIPVDFGVFAVGIFTNTDDILNNAIGDLAADGDVRFVVGEVPIPGALPLLIAGLGAFGGLRRLQRTQA